MTFDLSPAQQAARERARAFADGRVRPSAMSIDETAAIPADVLRDGAALVADLDPTALVVVVEDVATVSAAVAATIALGAPDGQSGADEQQGLRGFATPAAADARARLVLAAVGIGIARAAVEEALDVLRGSARGAQEQEKPHWVVADAATEVEAARLLTLQAAQAIDGEARDAAAAVAKLVAAKAAQQAVDAALRVAGPESLVRGTRLERLSRDARAVSLLMGTEEDLRAAAAQSLYR